MTEPEDEAFELVGGERLADLGALVGLAELAFGRRGQRSPGWFERKLEREGVDPRLCALALAAGRSATEPVEAESVVGYALLGRAESLGRVARGSGVAVRPGWRRRGLGRALVELALARARAAGCEAVTLLAEPERLPWYLEAGFTPVREELTLLAPGGLHDGPSSSAGFSTVREGLGLLAPDDLPDGSAGFPTVREGLGLLAPGGLLDGSSIPWSWVPEFWRRTPTSQRAVLELPLTRGLAQAWLSREGQAWLVHRLELAGQADPIASAVVEAVTALRGVVPPSTPLLLYPCPAAAPWLPGLSARGWRVAQRSFVVRRELWAGPSR